MKGLWGHFKAFNPLLQVTSDGWLKRGVWPVVVGPSSFMGLSD